MIIPYFSMFKTLFFGQYTNTMFYKFNDFKNKLDIQHDPLENRVKNNKKSNEL